jgi:SAM-dependent methyltransferase
MVADRELLRLQDTLYTSRNPTRRWLHCARRDWIIETLRRYAAERFALALEIGPGSGIYLPVLAELCDTVVAADIEMQYLDRARELASEHRNIRIAVDDITATALPTGAFDAILCTEVVEHIADSATALANMRKLLKPGGLLVLSTPQRYSPLEVAAKIAFLPGVIQLVRAIYREAIVETGHINLMTARQVQEQLRAAGFTVAERHKSGLYLPLLAEFGGRPGLQVMQALENNLRGTGLDWILWTQYYVARA